MLKQEIKHIREVLEIIFKDSKRDNIKVLQGYLCNEILHNFTLYEKYFNRFHKEKFSDFCSFLAFVFNIDSIKMNEILEKLEIYKNYSLNELNARIDCMSVRLY